MQQNDQPGWLYMYKAALLRETVSARIVSMNRLPEDSKENLEDSVTSGKGVA